MDTRTRSPSHGIRNEVTLAIKSWFRGGANKNKQEPQEYSIDDLIVLERYEEASERLLAKLKLNSNDLHSHLKLAEVYVQLRRFDKAVGEFIFVAEEYAQDGFYDKGVALLSKAMKLAPLDQTLRFKIEKLQREKGMEHVRTLALEGLRRAGGQEASTSALELKRLWHNLADSIVVQRLPGDQLQRLFSAMKLVRFAQGATVVEEGSRDAYLLLIVIGVLEAFIDDGGRSVLVRSFSSGDIVGEAALLERGVWPASFRASEAVTALKLTREGLEQALVGNPDPRAFLETLREQHNDRDIAGTVRRLRGSS
jgi:tetratricopeptide (TPR) repeat protein